MGKGDKKSKKGKLFQGSFGNNRPKKKHNVTSAVKKTPAVAVTPTVSKPAAKKAAKKKAE